MWRDCRSAKRETGCSPIRSASKASSCWCSGRASPGPHRLWRPNGCSKRCWRLWRQARRRGSLRALPGFPSAFCTARRSSAPPPRAAFEPLMTLYLTDDTPPEEIALATRSGHVFGVKLYPAGATTHSDEGVTRLSRCFHALEKMAEVGMPLLIHGESTDPAIDVFDREKAFIEETLGPTLERFPQLKVVLEHITTRDAVQYVEVTGANVAATITAHHLLMNRNALFMGGIRPHHYCLPVLKREEHREALVEAATSGNPKFFLGTDSAPHARAAKEAGCGCAGIYTAHGAIELYAIAFEEAGALDKLEGFASEYGARFYGLPVNSGRITLVREDWKVPERLAFGGEELVPLRAGESIPWKLA